MNPKSYLAACLFLIAGAADCFAQSGEWASYFSDKLIKVEYREMNCSVPNTDINKKVYCFRLINLTPGKLQVNWQQELHYGSNCINCNGNNKEMAYTATLMPNTSQEGDCTKEGGLVVFGGFVSPDAAKKNTPSVTDFKIKNIQAGIIP